MKYKAAGAFRASLEQRLRDRSREVGTSIVRLRKAVVFDRLLARLLQVAPERWVVKGALALDFRLSTITRTTKDLDLVYRESQEAAAADLAAAQAVDPGDYFAFALERVRIGGAAEKSAKRYRARAEVAGRIFDEVIVDIGFVDPILWKPDLVLGTDLLGFAAIDRMQIPVLPLEQHVAEKVHAYTRTYGEGMPSSRVKDLVDIVLIKSFASLDAEQVRKALQITFEARSLQRLPDSLPAPPPDWVSPYRKLASEVGIDPQLAVAHAEAAKLLDPVLSGSARGRWNSEQNAWVPR
ncbi:MAG: nucleotidyl transferase AbiEii/AbiGii toxin family protein [Anaerolineales bacterium]